MAFSDSTDRFPLVQQPTMEILWSMWQKPSISRMWHVFWPKQRHSPRHAKCNLAKLVLSWKQLIVISCVPAVAQRPPSVNIRWTGNPWCFICISKWPWALCCCFFWLATSDHRGTRWTGQYVSFFFSNNSCLPEYCGRRWITYHVFGSLVNVQV